MKQLLPISKKSKQTLKKNSLRLSLQELSDQQDNFVYQQYEQKSTQRQKHDNNDYAPSQQEVILYAEILGIKLPEQQDLLYIAKQCLQAPIPDGWTCQSDEQGQVYYTNMRTGQTKLQHPCDEIYKQKVIVERKKKIKDLVKAIPKINMPKSKTSFVENVFKPKNQQKIASQVNDAKAKPPSKLQSIINQGMKNSKKQQDIIDHDFQPKMSIKSHIKQPPLAKNIKKQQKEQPKTSSSKQKLKNEIKVNLNIKSKKMSPEMMQDRKRQIQQRIKNKYQQKINDIKQQYIVNLKQMKNKEDQIRNADGEHLKQIIGQSKIQRRRKQIQAKLMMQHAIQIDKKRAQAQRTYRKDLLILSSKYQIQQLFTQMSQCRKFINRDKNQMEKNDYFSEIQHNMKTINLIQTEKTVTDIQKQSRKMMYQILNRLLSNFSQNQLAWEKQNQIFTIFQENLNEIFNKYTKQPQEFNFKNTKSKEDTFKQSENLAIRQTENIYGQLQMLKRKLKELQQQNNTQRSNLSDKQNKLMDLLQGRAGASSSRSSHHS